MSVAVLYFIMFRNNELLFEVCVMKNYSQRTRLILGIAAVLISVLLVWLLTDVLGEAAMFLLPVGGGIFIWLNPELMRGE